MIEIDSRDIGAAYALSSAVSLVAPLVKSIGPALVGLTIVVFCFSLFFKNHTPLQIFFGFATLGLAVAALLFTIDPVLLATHLA